MGEINLSRVEQEALKRVDIDVLDALIKQGISEGGEDTLQGIQLERCGQYVASALRHYEKALAEYAMAKSAKTRDESKDRVRYAGDDLVNAVQQMRHRAETEVREGELFYIEDNILRPDHFTKRLTVSVHFRWRRAVEDEWQFGSISFCHTAELLPGYAMLIPKRKPSAAKLEQDQQAELRREWEHLMKLGLYSMREYFRSGGEGAAVPATFQAVSSTSSRSLNNFSTQFWPVGS
jgi:hypothetical protein